MKNIVLLGLILALTACGGGGSDTVSSNPEGVKPPSDEVIEVPVNPYDEIVYGGAPSAAALVNDIARNAISLDPFQNYYYVDMEEGDTLYLNVVPSRLPTRTEGRDCALGMDDTYYIRISDEMDESDIGINCSENIKYVADNSGKKLIRFQYPEDIEGWFRTTLVKKDAPLIPVEPKGVGFKANAPGLIDYDGDNFIQPDSNFSHYYVSAEAGQTLIVHAYPDRPISSQESKDCALSGGTYTGGVGLMLLDDKSFTCNDTLEHTFEYAGDYVLYIKYPEYSSGYFRAQLY